MWYNILYNIYTLLNLIEMAQKLESFKSSTFKNSSITKITRQKTREVYILDYIQYKSWKRKRAARVDIILFFVYLRENRKGDVADKMYVGTYILCPRKNVFLSIFNREEGKEKCLSRDTFRTEKSDWKSTVRARENRKSHIRFIFYMYSTNEGRVVGRESISVYLCCGRITQIVVLGEMVDGGKGRKAKIRDRNRGGGT